MKVMLTITDPGDVLEFAAPMIEEITPGVRLGSQRVRVV